MPNRDDKYGDPVGESRWFRGDPTFMIRDVFSPPTRETHWLCPQDDCEGEMLFDGEVWATATPGYHHTCNKCGFRAALEGVKYPKIVEADPL